MTRKSRTRKTMKNSGKTQAAALDSRTSPSVLVRAMVTMKRTVISPATTEISKAPI